MTSNAFAWETIWYYIANTGIPINFGITIAIALLFCTGFAYGRMTGRPSAKGTNTTL